MINLGLIGMGDVGKIHFYNSLHLENARLVAVADISRRARRLAKSYGVKEAYDDYQKLLENRNIDCVIIALPNFLHAECATMAAEFGKHMLIEKPLARDIEEGKQIVAKARKSGVQTMVGYPLRFSQLARLKEEISSGRLGDITSALATHISYGPFYHRATSSAKGTSVPIPVPSWRFQVDLMGGGALIDLGSHMINLLRWFFGDGISSAKAVLGHRFNMPFEDQAYCFLRFKQGTVAILNVSWCSVKPVTRVELFGIADTVSMAMEHKHKFSARNILPLRKSVAESSPWYKELDYFVDCVVDDLEIPLSAEDGLKDLEIISLAYRNQS